VLGPRHKSLLTHDLRWLLQAAVIEAEKDEFNGDSMESDAWAYLVIRSLKGLPINSPGTTGAPVPLSGGRLAEPA
jgi:anhydro-N-acetylmuramic acid kinase